MFIIFVSNAIVSPILWLFNFYLIYLYIRRAYLTQKKLDEMESKWTQRELNTFFENPKVEFAFKFSYILKTVLMSLFYAPILPCGVIISLFGLIFAYWVEKYNIVRHYKLPEMPNENLADFLLDNFKIVIFTYSVGVYLFMDDVYNTQWALGLIIAMGCLCFLPISAFLKISLVNMDESEIHQDSFDDVYLDFNIDYERANPLTKKEGFKSYIKALNDKKIISEVEYKILYENIEKKKLSNILKYHKGHIRLQKNTNFLKHKK